MNIYFQLSFVIQIIHSLEELLTGFHKRWYLIHIPFWIFLLFEIVFSGFWFSVLLIPSFPYRELLMQSFLFLMLLNGAQHIVWSLVKKQYMPGLITAPVHIINSFTYVYTLFL